MDVVITYVDITERFKEQYSKYVKKELEENRFRSYGVLDLQIKGIRKYMPYIKNIFVVVSEKEQVEGIDLSDAIIIEHKDIIPERYLPCFNSCTIEMFIWKIPGLSEEFIYFNDDIFVIDKVPKSYWFINHKPVLFPKEHELIDEENIYKRNCINSSKLAIELTKSNIKNKYFTQAHCARPFLKSTCEKVFNLKVLDIIHTLTRTRHSKNYNASLFNDYDYLSGNCYIMENKYSYANAWESIDNIINIINKKENSIICINDNDIYTDLNEFNEYIKNILKLNLQGEKYNIKKKENKKIILNNNPLKVALCAIAKNENLYIREWVEWYKNLGISKIFLYDNNELDGERFEEVINDYIEEGFVEVIDRRGVEKGCVYDEEGINLQPKCYIEFYEGEGRNYDWICFFDIDEFLTFKDNYNLFNFLNYEIFNNIDTILVPWEHYDDNDLLYYDSRPVMERFTHLSKRAYHGVKSIVRTNKIINDKKQGCLIHIFRLIDNKVMFSSGLKINTYKTWYQFNECEFNKSFCKLNHYKTKSLEEYLKRHLGRHWGTGKKYTDNPLTISKCKDEYFKYNNITTEKLDFINNYLSLDSTILNNYEIYKQDLINFGLKKGISLNLDNPITINDKINWIKIHPTNLKIKCADKILVHNYSKQILGKDICIPILKVYNNINEINFDELPNKYVIKCNHGCGYNIIVKNNLIQDKDKIKSKLNKWLSTNFAFKAGYEMQYDRIKPRIYVEKYMGDISDYKFWCFNGEPLFWVYSLGNNGGLTEHLNFYDMNNNLTKLNNAIHPPDPNIIPIIPNNFNNMIDIAKKLSKPFDFVRVDLYSINDKIYLGELTFTPSGGWMRFGDDSIMLGNLINLYK